MARHITAGRRIAHRRTRSPLATRLTSRHGSRKDFGSTTIVSSFSSKDHSVVHSNDRHNVRVNNRRQHHTARRPYLRCNSTEKRASPPRPYNAYIGQNFSVRLCQFFRLHSAIEGSSSTDIVHTSFDPLRRFEHMCLSREATKIRDVPNAGGSSVVSETLSYEMLRACFGADLLKTEMEMQYYPEGGSITDYSCSMFQTTLGVSVTRAMKFRGEFAIEDAERLLMKKLSGVIQSSHNAVEKWSKQVLHVWAASDHVSRVLTQAYCSIPKEVKSNTVVLVTVATNANEIFTNKY